MLTNQQFKNIRWTNVTERRLVMTSFGREFDNCLIYLNKIIFTSPRFLNTSCMDLKFTKVIIWKIAFQMSHNQQSQEMISFKDLFLEDNSKCCLKQLQTKSILPSVLLIREEKENILK